MKFSLFLTGLAVLSLSACGTPQPHIVDDGQYWQRSSVSDAAYIQGPKAQQMLNRDIAGCVAELRELERLGEIREAIPANPHNDKVLSSDEMALQAWDEPERVKYLLAEHGNYHDFETCMVSNGWERVKHVPYDVAHNARKNYMKNHVDYDYMPPAMATESHVQTQEDGEYSELNN
ncbi:MAG: hypothetical protein ACLFR0_06775 [Alphaproteobacteria bacterium]